MSFERTAVVLALAFLSGLLAGVAAFFSDLGHKGGGIWLLPIFLLLPSAVALLLARRRAGTKIVIASGAFVLIGLYVASLGWHATEYRENPLWVYALVFGAQFAVLIVPVVLVALVRDLLIRRSTP